MIQQAHLQISDTDTTKTGTLLRQILPETACWHSKTPGRYEFSQNTLVRAFVSPLSTALTFTDNESQIRNKMTRFTKMTTNNVYLHGRRKEKLLVDINRHKMLLSFFRFKTSKPIARNKWWWVDCLLVSWHRSPSKNNGSVSITALHYVSISIIFYHPPSTLHVWD